jgi:hypothetical protein
MRREEERLRLRTLEVHSGPSRLDRLLPHDPVVDVLASFILSDAMAFLNLALKLFALAGNLVEIIIRKMTPLLLDLAFELFPVSLQTPFVSKPRQRWAAPCALTVTERRWFHRCLGVSSRTSGFYIGLLVFLS